MFYVICSMLTKRLKPCKKRVRNIRLISFLLLCCPTGDMCVACPQKFTFYCSSSTQVRPHNSVFDFDFKLHNLFNACFSPHERTLDSLHVLIFRISSTFARNCCTACFFVIFSRSFHCFFSYQPSHSSIKIGQNLISFGFSDPSSMSAVQKVCPSPSSKRNFVYSQFLRLLSSSHWYIGTKTPLIKAQLRIVRSCSSDWSQR
jgi:hypothetical protein